MRPARLLRQAYDTDPRDLAVRGLLVETLIQLRVPCSIATGSAPESWPSPRLTSIRPTRKRAAWLSLIADKKRDEAIDQCNQSCATDASPAAIPRRRARWRGNRLSLSIPTPTRLIQLARHPAAGHGRWQAARKHAIRPGEINALRSAGGRSSRTPTPNAKFSPACGALAAQVSGRSRVSNGVDRYRKTLRCR